MRRPKAVLNQRAQILSFQAIALLSRPRKRPSALLVVSNLDSYFLSRQLTSKAGNDVGDEVASKILAVFLAKPASVSVGIETLVSASGSSSIVALFPTTYPITGPIDPTLSLSTPLALSEQFSASVSKSYSHGAATASKTTTSLSFTTQAPGLTQAPAPFSISVTTNNTGNGSTITSPPPGFSTFTASNPLWTSDTSTEINGTLCPVFYVGHHEGIVLAGLGGKPDDPVRPGCSGLFKSFIGCGTWIKLPHLGIFRINSDGVPIPQGEPTDPVEPGDPGTDGNPDDPGDPDDHHNDPDDPDDPDDENDTAQPTVHTREKTDSKSGRHDSSMFLQSSPNTWASAGSSTFKSVVQTKSSARHSGTGTTAFTRSKQSTLNTALRSTLSRSSTASTTSATATSTTLNTALRSTLPRSSTASTASATATSTNYIICLEPDISASQLEDITNDVKAHTTSTYSISLGSRPNDTVICAKLNPSSSAQFNADSRVSEPICLYYNLSSFLEILNQFLTSSGLCGSSRREGRSLGTGPDCIAGSW